MVSIEETLVEPALEVESSLDEMGESDKVPQISPGDGEWKDLMGSDLMMKVIKPSSGEEPTPVQPEDAVLIDFVGYQASTKFEKGHAFHEAKDWWIVIGEKDVLPGLELGVRFMNENETALIWASSKYAYGYGGRDDGTKTLAPNSNVLYEVTVKAIASQEQRSDLSFQVELATSKKQIANDVYVNEWSDGLGKGRVLQLYKRTSQAMERLSQSGISDDSIRERAFQLHLDCLNNITAVHLRAKEYHEAKKAAVEVLQHDPNNFKGLCRAAKAALLDPASSYEEVDAAIEAAAEQADANDMDVARLKADFRRRKQLYKLRQKEIFSKIGKGLNATSGATKKNDDAKLEEKTEDGNLEESDVTLQGNISEQTQDTEDPSGNQIQDAEDLSFWSKLQELPWRTRILPYTFQIFLAFAMYSYYLVLKQKQGLKVVLPMSSEYDNESDSEF